MRPTRLKRKLYQKDAQRGFQHKSDATKQTTRRISQASTQRAAKKILTIKNSSYYFMGKSLFFMNKGNPVLVEEPTRIHVPTQGGIKEIFMVRDPSNGDRFILEGNSIREPKPGELPNNIQ